MRSWVTRNPANGAGLSLSSHTAESSAKQGVINEMIIAMTMENFIFYLTKLEDHPLKYFQTFSLRSLS